MGAHMVLCRDTGPMVRTASSRVLQIHKCSKQAGLLTWPYDFTHINGLFPDLHHTPGRLHAMGHEKVNATPRSRNPLPSREMPKSEDRA